MNLHKVTAALPLVALVALATVAPPAADAGTIPAKKYRCYVFYAPGVPTYTGRYITIVSASKYKFFNGASAKAGTYAHTGAEKLKFRSGPLKGKKGEHAHYGTGHGVRIQMASGAAGQYSCS